MSNSSFSLHPSVPGAVYLSMIRGIPLDVDARPVDPSSARFIDVCSVPDDDSPCVLPETTIPPARQIASSASRFAASPDLKWTGADEKTGILLNGPTPSAGRPSSPFLPRDLTVNSWDDLKPYFDDLTSRPISSAAELETLVLDYSLVLKVYGEAYSWANIMQSRHTDDEGYNARLDLFNTGINPKVNTASNAVNKRIAENEFFVALPDDRYGQLKKILARQLKMYVPQNEKPLAELAELESKYNQIVGGLSVEIGGETMTIPQARVLTRGKNRAVREQAWLAIQAAYAGVKPQIDALYDQIIKKANEVARNAGYANYRDYAHDDRMRFDYTVEDAQKFADAIETHVVPLAKEIYRGQAARLGLEPGEMRPWDAHWRNMPSGPDEEPLHPFATAEELKQKGIEVFSKVRPEFGDNLRRMDAAGLFDLESRPNKQSGAYNSPLPITGMPFMLMNAAGTAGDVQTFMHEGGHSQHSFLTTGDPLIQYQDYYTPAEQAETASMGMELISMKYWDTFYGNPDELSRARREKLEETILFLPWCAVVDSIQQWVYTHPDHTAAERDAKFKELMKRFGLAEGDWSGYEDYLMGDFLAQMHIFQMPFYYLEYGIANLGALQLYRNDLQNPETALDGYVAGLSMGYAKGLPDIWSAMGIDFDFSAEKIQELMAFIGGELAKVN